MDLEFSPDQTDLLDAVRQFLAAERPVSGLGAARTPQDLDRRWRETAELGWLSISLDESDGGVGYGFADEALVFEELGRVVAPGPFLPNVLAARLAALTGARELLSSLTSGASRAGLAVPSGPWEISDTRVAGTFLVVDGDGADLLLVWGDTGIAVVSHDPDALRPVASLDEVVPLGELDLHGAVALAVADESQGADLHVRATVLAAAILAGISASLVEMSVGYAKERKQFGKPIGTFQAVSRRCADMAVRASSAGALVRVAALCVEEQRSDAPYQAAAAKLFAGEAAQANAMDTIQNHGSIGWTAEHDAHRFLKRARLIDTLWGDARRQAPVLIHDHPRAIGLGGEVAAPVAVGHNAEKESR